MSNNDQQRYRAAVRTTVVNASINSLLAVLKIIIGYAGFSQALVADGIHSLSDLATDALVLISAKLGRQKPDLEHPYGHRRIETIGAIIISIVLIVVAIGIAYDNVMHIVQQTHLPIPSISVMIIAIISIIANEFLFRYTLYEGNKVNSDLLRTNAWHNRSDVWVSVIVLLSVIGSMIGIHYLDSAGAILIALLIFKMGLKLTWNSVKELVDTGVDKTTLTQITNLIKETPGVVAIHQLRTRSHGGSILLDVHIQVSPLVSVSEGHFIGDQVQLALLKHFSNIEDITVHIDPEDDEISHPCKNLPNRPALEAALQKHCQHLPGYSSISQLQLHYLNGQLILEIYLPHKILDSYDKANLQQQYCNATNKITKIKTVKIYFT